MNRIMEFEARFEKRRADALEREIKQRARVRPTQHTPQKPPIERSDGEKREPAHTAATWRRSSAVRVLAGEDIRVLTYIPIAEGLAAGQAGLPSFDNPYRGDTEERVRWHAGWMEGRIAERSAPRA